MSVILDRLTIIQVVPSLAEAAISGHSHMRSTPIDIGAAPRAEMLVTGPANCVPCAKAADIALGCPLFPVCRVSINRGAPVSWSYS